MRRMLSLTLSSLLVASLAPLTLGSGTAHAASGVEEAQVAGHPTIEALVSELETMEADEAKELIGSAISYLKDEVLPGTAQPAHTPCSSPTIGCLIELMVHMVEHKIWEIEDIVYDIIEDWGNAVCRLLLGRDCTP